MTPRSTRVTIGAALAATMLLVTACSSGDDASDDDLAGVDQGSQEPEPSEDPEESADPDAGPEDPDAPTFDFLGQFEVIISDDTTGDEETDELLRDHGYALKAMREGYVQQEATDNFFRYYGAPVDSSYLYDFDRFADEGWILTGKDHFYARNVVKLADDQAIIDFCEDTSGGYTADKDSGENVDQERDIEFSEYREYRMGLERHEDGHWQVITAEFTRGSEECANAVD